LNAFRWFVVLWTALAVGLSVVLFFGGGGHPPPMILIPFVWMAWLVIVAAAIVGRLLQRWLRRRSRVRTEP